MDPQKLADYLKTRNTKHETRNRPKAVIPVHLYGQPADMDEIIEIAGRHNLVIIEDACQAHGAKYKDRVAGSFGAAGCFSFYPGKNLGAFGEAGAVVTHDEKLADKMRMIRDHGQQKKYHHEIEGYNGRLDAIQAGVLRIKLKRLKDWNLARREKAAYYSERLKQIPGIQIPFEADFATSVYHLYVILLDDRDGLQQYLAEKGISTGLHYPLPLHLQKAYSHFGYKRGDFPVSEQAADRLLSLPMFPELTTQQIDHVVDSIKEFMNNR
jgi:dTDP-4-amino-4,6-dideoxygalactose transaminase